ncbi:hypothetical protein ACJ7C5_09975 [Nocardiopsis yanglingensis]
MDIVVKEELKAYIDPLTADEHDALERSILAEGCRDALVLWGEVLVDGHNRFGICQKHGLPFNTVQNTRFQSMEDVHLWMIEQHLGRRSVSDFQRGVLALRKRDILAARKQMEQAQLQRESDGTADVVEDAGEDSPPWEPAPKISRAELAREAKLSTSQVGMIERIHAQAAAEVVEAVKAGVISISAAAAVADLPEDEQRAAAAGGKDELKQAAKRVRESKRKPRAPKPEAAEMDFEEADEEQIASRDAEVLSALEQLGEDAPALRRRVVALTRENDTLRAQLAALRKQLEALSTTGLGRPRAGNPMNVSGGLQMPASGRHYQMLMPCRLDFRHDACQRSAPRSAAAPESPRAGPAAVDAGRFRDQPLAGRARHLGLGLGVLRGCSRGRTGRLVRRRCPVPAADGPADSAYRHHPAQQGAHRRQPGPVRARPVP